MSPHVKEYRSHIFCFLILERRIKGFSKFVCNLSLLECSFRWKQDITYKFLKFLFFVEMVFRFLLQKRFICVANVLVIFIFESRFVLIGCVFHG